MSTAPLLAAQPCLDFSDSGGWHQYRAGPVVLWFNGHLFGNTPAALAKHLAVHGSTDIAAWLAGLDGCFAIAAQGPGWALAATDRIRTVPIFFGHDGERWRIAGHAPAMRQILAATEVDREQALVLGMSGYTFSGHTLYRGLGELPCGMFVLFHGDRADQRAYHSYRPWLTRQRDEAAWKRELAETILAIVDKMAISSAGRTIIVPLSAGLDSRLVVSALKHLGHRNVACMSYGLPGNHEARGAQAIAGRLGFPWTMVPHTLRQQAATLRGEIARIYENMADSLAAVPFQQDLHAALRLREGGLVPGDAIVVNGQSGDYIAGNHIPPSLFAPGAGDAATRWRRITDALVGKHYALWGVLNEPQHEDLVRRLIIADLEACGATLGDPEHDFALHELSEFRNRQAKYVVGGQRIYEFAGFEWRLPLWDRQFIEFWESVPIKWKARQRLYRETLEECNWGGVWGPDWRIKRTIAPAWLRPIRATMKALHAPLGRARWHRFEHRNLAYLTDVVANYAVVPYRQVRADHRGHRNAISWHVERYLAAKGLALDGSDLRP